MLEIEKGSLNYQTTFEYVKIRGRLIFSNDLFFLKPLENLRLSY